MVFKPINLARQSFIKTFTHGYAQSLVAASQSSSASHNTPFQSLGHNVVGNLLNAKGGSVSQHAQLHSSGGAKLAQTDVIANGSESGLAAYYAAWQKHQKTEDKEWHQFQFAKRIGWKAPTTIPDPQHLAKSNKQSSTQQPHDDVLARPQRIPLERSRSTSAVDELARAGVQDVELEKQRLQQIDQAIAQEIASGRQQAADAAAEDASAVASPSSVGNNSALSEVTAPTSVSDIDPYVEQLVHLAESNRYAEVPAVFEALLVAGIKPTASAYNALLLAAINLPRGRHQVVPKVLDVYSDMLRRHVAPDTATYAILIELMAARALDVAAMKKELNLKRTRYALPESKDSFMFSSDVTEHDILAEDYALDLAIKLFDTSAAVSTNHRFTPETYRLLITACAEHGKIGDMLRVYADMESHQVLAPTSIFSPMIDAFASVGDLRSVVECYDEYRDLAIAHNSGSLSMVRKDEEVYAAVVRAYITCGRTAGGLKFLGAIEDDLQNDSAKLSHVRDTVTLQALHPHWFSENRHSEALSDASTRLTGAAQTQAAAAICTDAADRNLIPQAIEAFNQITDKTTFMNPAVAVLSMFIRNGDLVAASNVWRQICAVQRTSVDLIEPGVMYALALIRNGSGDSAVQELRRLFVQIRHQSSSGNQRAQTDMLDRMDEAITIIGQSILKITPVPSMFASVELVRMMTENGSLDTSIAEHLIAALGPQEISTLTMSDVTLLIQVQAGLLATHSHLDVAHAARLSHLLDITMSAGLVLDKATFALVEQALNKLDRPDLISRLQGGQAGPIAAVAAAAATAPVVSPTIYSAPYSPASSPAAAPAPYEDNFDPYGATTDFKGSTMIAEELEKTTGRHANHLNEALTRFKNMRRAGRHPRYVIYAKLISAATKENRLSLAQEIFAMAKKDVPLVMQSRVVRHGWVSILDAMVGACLNLGNRDLAGQYHQELLNMGSAPSANTFGLYITTLKESTKTFDEATEAVKIFHRAKAEGIEPSSFLYNALIGKLGKARRIDDCLFYFAEMRNKGIRPTSVTYGTIVNALCRVSDDKFAEELFEEMESMPNYKPRPAPYNSLMQYFLTTKRDRSKVLDYYNRMLAKNIEPTMHTYKLLIDTHATLEPIDMPAAEAVLSTIQASKAQPEAVHYASLIHAKGCVQHDMAGARAVFDSVIKDGRIRPQPALYQALFESMVANHDVAATEPLVQQMAQQRVELTPYIANTLIHGWATAGDIAKARQIYDRLGRENREPSTYEAMVRAYLSVEERGRAKAIVGEALSRGYPAAVASRVCELVAGGATASSSNSPTASTSASS